MRPMIGDIIFVLAFGALNYFILKFSITNTLIVMLILSVLLFIYRIINKTKFYKRHLEKPKIPIIGSYMVGKYVLYLFGGLFIFIGGVLLVMVILDLIKNIRPSFFGIIIIVLLYLLGFTLIIFEYRYWKRKKE